MWAELLSQSQNRSVPASNFYNIMLMHECIIGSGGSLQRRAKVNKMTAAKQPMAENVTQFVQMFLERGGLIFLTTFFTSLDKSGLESCTIKYKALTMLIEIVSQLLSSRWQKTINEMMTEQIVFDIFQQNLLIIHNYIMAVEQQQSCEITPGSRPLRSEQHLISISLQLCQKMMF